MRLREIAQIKAYRKLTSKLMLEFEQVDQVGENCDRVEFKYQTLTKSSNSVSKNKYILNRLI